MLLLQLLLLLHLLLLLLQLLLLLSEGVQLSDPLVQSLNCLKD